MIGEFLLTFHGFWGNENVVLTVIWLTGRIYMARVYLVNKKNGRGVFGPRKLVYRQPILQINRTLEERKPSAR